MNQYIELVAQLNSYMAASGRRMREYREGKKEGFRENDTVPHFVSHMCLRTFDA